MVQPGALNLITDVPGFLVGHADDDKAKSGVTILLCEKQFRAGVDVRGGGPGTRETEVLDAHNLVGAAHGFILSGGSVFGLAAADGATAKLSAQGTGLRLADSGPHIPIIPAAVLHDLTYEGDKEWGENPPYRALGAAAVENAGQDFALGSVGAGLGARAGNTKGGIGSASIDLGGGLFVGALAAVNSAGAAIMPDNKTYYAWPYEIAGEFGAVRPSGDVTCIDPLPEQSRLGAKAMPRAGENTTLCIIACSADLTSAENKRVAMMAHDGMARAIRPAHTPFDGDIVFSVASATTALGEAEAMRAFALARIGAAAGDVLARAIARGVYEANK